MHILADGEVRFTFVELIDAPFARAMLMEPDVHEALKAWMLAARGPSWMSWTDVEAALHNAGVDLAPLIARYPATSAG